MLYVIYWRRNWQPTLVVLPGESQGWRRLVGCCLWGCTESDITEAAQQRHVIYRHRWCYIYISLVQSLSRVRLFVTPWTAARQASLSISNSPSLLKFMSIESVMPSNHLILCHPLLLPSIFPSIRVFSSESALCIRWPKYWSFSFSIVYK